MVVFQHGSLDVIVVIVQRIQIRRVWESLKVEPGTVRLVLHDARTLRNGGCLD